MAAPALVTAQLPAGGRLIAIGDIHGCIAELERLLARIAPTSSDLVVSAGDIVRKGPDPVACLELWRSRGYLAVTGNNEEKLLGFGFLRRLFLPRADRRVLGRKDLVEYIRSWPLVIDVPAASSAIVHGGLLPQMAITNEDVLAHRRDVPRLRWIRPANGSWERVPKNKQREGDVLWPAVWSGNRTIVYGHTPLDQPRIDPKAIGIDTGCVYGGSLTAAVWDRGTWTLLSEPARRESG